MAPEPIRVSGSSVDLSTRAFETHTVSASPALAAETIIATLTVTGNVVAAFGVQLWGWASFTVGTSGVSAKLLIRQTNTSGSIINIGTGATTVAATNIIETGCQGVDTASTLPGQVYVLTLTIGSGAASSTVAACQLLALVI